MQDKNVKIEQIGKNEWIKEQVQEKKMVEQKREGQLEIKIYYYYYY